MRLYYQTCISTRIHCTLLGVSTGSILAFDHRAVCHQSPEVTLQRVTGGVMMYLCILIPWSYRMMVSAVSTDVTRHDVLRVVLRLVCRHPCNSAERSEMCYVFS